MKRLLALVLVGMMILPAISLAEEFTLRNGIVFGDTMEDVLAKETFTISEVVDEKDDKDREYPYSISTGKTTLADISNSYIWYRFDENKQLREVVYEFRSSTNRDTADNDYGTVNSGLIRKYGNSLGYSNGACYIFAGTALIGAAKMVGLYKAIGGYGDLRNYDEWDVKSGNYHVKIEQVEYYYGSSSVERKYCHRVSYTYFTDDDLNELLQQKKDSQASIDNDL